ncbi:MAG: selenocysteine-specific translation elongation factor [Rhodospirillales bacterium]|nr:selenocysteine-specific translation elongation factor [Rhodospirillales bacterium]
MIVVTAGHVDHGKTALVRALTGIDTDRLPEERRRGMTIDLGFAYIGTETGGRIGFVDVPGHERLVHNMICGVGGVDLALVVVAADDGAMPQTHEHLAILDLLAVPRAAVVVTKTDRVAASRVAEVGAELAGLLAPTPLAGAPVFAVSAPTGNGIAALRAHLERMAQQTLPGATRGHFRMPVDRSFTVSGAGLVVTGTVLSGAVAAGGTVRAMLAGLPARVRTIHAQSAPAGRGEEGQRCAINLAGEGVAAGRIARGDWIVAGAVPPPARKLDARLRILASETRGFAHWTPVHLHLGAADVTGRVAVLDGGAIAAGASALVQLVLDRPVGAVRGDRFVIRDQAARRTLGGGRVIDLFPPARGRARPERLAHLAAMEIEDDAAALAALLETAPAGLDLGRFAANRNLIAAEAAGVFAGSTMRRVATAAGTVGFSPRCWEALRRRALALLAAWHAGAPDRLGPSQDRVFAASGMRVASEVCEAIVAELAAEGRVVRQGMRLRLREHQPALVPAHRALWREVLPRLEAGGHRPPTVPELAAAIGHDARKLEAFLTHAGRLGLVVRVSEKRCALPATLRRLGEIAEAAAIDGRVTAAAFRDRAGIGRNLAVELLEYFDRVRFTRRIGDAHEILRPIGAVFGDAGDPEYSDTA